MYRHLNSCRDQLHLQLIHTLQLPRSTEFQQVLTYLEESEKLYLRSIFIACAWNVGSTKVLSLLQRSSILSMTEYIYHQFEAIDIEGASSFMVEFDSEEINRQRSESVQLILNDLLETEFVLLADLVYNLGCSHSVGLKITDILKECFRRLIIDVYTNPEMVQNNYLHGLRAFVGNKTLEQVRLLHWNVFAELESCSILEAISNQQTWNAEFVQKSSKSLVAIMLEVSLDISTFLNSFVELVKSNAFSGWRWWLHFWGLLVSQESVNEQTFATIRKHLKEMFRLFLATKSDAIFFAMMLCARQTCVCAHKGFDSYAKWYKKSIGEMQYGQSKDEFRRTMQTMTKMIKHETDVDVLEVHANTVISAPAYCGDLVLSFKQISKSWLNDLKGHHRGNLVEIDDTEQFVLN